jgi:hypothetical protein
VVVAAEYFGGVVVECTTKTPEPQYRQYHNYNRRKLALRNPVARCWDEKMDQKSTPRRSTLMSLEMADNQMGE